jgi:hypothetical protein
MAGYSGKPLAAKLGIKPGLKVYVDRAPAALDLGTDEVVTRLPKHADIIITFHENRARLDKRMAVLIEHTVVNGMIWVCWPKRASGMQTDLNENVVREIGLAAGVVDVKVDAIDETWSGLKFVRRLKDR